MTIVKFILSAVVVVFVVPTVITLGWWLTRERPADWRSADWSSSAILPAAASSPDAAVYILGARTGGLKGAFSVHSWIVVKEAGASSYDRYDKVGWGLPVRRNSRAADALWYSNRPFVVRELRGDEASALIPQIRAAIDSYPFGRSGDYRVWPGPNSNSFVAHVLRSVSGLGAMPPNATGRDFAPGLAAWGWSSVTRDFHVTVHGLAGFSVGATSGLEVHLLGLVAGVDFANPALKIPAYGRFPLS